MEPSTALVASYTPSVRSCSWLKLKRDYITGIADTVDVVPIGAWPGNGRKAGWYSPILLAAYDPDSEQWQSVCRVMSGLNDAFYASFTEFFSQPENQLERAAAKRIYLTGACV